MGHTQKNLKRIICERIVSCWKRMIASLRKKGTWKNSIKIKKVFEYNNYMKNNKQVQLCNTQLYCIQFLNKYVKILNHGVK